jgi:hypothetical protein
VFEAVWDYEAGALSFGVGLTDIREGKVGSCGFVFAFRKGIGRLDALG